MDARTGEAADMTRPGWLLSDGSLVTVLVGFRELRMPAEALDVMLSGHVGNAVLTDDCLVVRGRVELSEGGERVWFRVAGRQLFAWTNDVRAVAYGDRASAPLNTVHGFSNTAPATGNAAPRHA
jgi:hypothetical protein